MSLVKGSINPLNILNMRKLDRIPPNFAKIVIKVNFNTAIKDLDQWIYTNLDSRYCIQKIHIVENNTNKLVSAYEIGVEDPKELTLLSLSCPHLYK